MGERRKGGREWVELGEAWSDNSELGGEEKGGGREELGRRREESTCIKGAQPLLMLLLLLLKPLFQTTKLELASLLP